mgnify:CR=1 FL=1
MGSEVPKRGSPHCSREAPPDTTLGVSQDNAGSVDKARATKRTQSPLQNASNWHRPKRACAALPLQSERGEPRCDGARQSGPPECREAGWSMHREKAPELLLKSRAYRKQDDGGHPHRWPRSWHGQRPPWVDVHGAWPHWLCGKARTPRWRIGPNTGPPCVVQEGELPAAGVPLRRGERDAAAISA